MNDEELKNALISIIMSWAETKQGADDEKMSFMDILFLKSFQVLMNNTDKTFEECRGLIDKCGNELIDEIMKKEQKKQKKKS